MSKVTQFDDGNGPALYVRRDLFEAGGEAVGFIAGWTDCPLITPGDVEDAVEAAEPDDNWETNQILIPKFDGTSRMIQTKPCDRDGGPGDQRSGAITASA